jgi:hypothetical protein
LSNADSDDVTSGTSATPLGVGDRPRAGGETAAFLTAIVQFVLNPDPVEELEPTSLTEVLLPWPVRCLTVVTIFVAAARWADTGIGQEIAWGLQIGGLALVAIITSYWLPLMLFDSSVAGLWFMRFPQLDPAGTYAGLFHVVTFVNRQLGHVAVFAVWSIVAFASTSQLSWQLGLMAAVLLLGPPILNGLARLPLSFLGPAPSTKHNGSLLWRRRIFIYLASILGIVVLAVRAPHQILRILPLATAFSGGIAIRTVRHWKRARVAPTPEREHFVEVQARIARHADRSAPLLVLGVLGALVFVSTVERHKLDDGIRPSSGARADDGCAREPFGPVDHADVTLLVLADAQTHELAGEPFPGDTELADVFVRTASRPLALELLSTVSPRHFGIVYRKSSGDHAPTLWAHLGDLADLACQRELDDAFGSLDDLLRHGRLAGIATGNHESAFYGSFHWNPYWDSVCQSGRLEKDQATQRIADRVTVAGEADAGVPSRPLVEGAEIVRETSPWAPRGGALVMVTPLGISRHAGKERGVIGVFLDTSDGRAFDDGMPGTVGAVSSFQINAALGAVDRVRKHGQTAYNNPVYVLFEHIPFGELETSSRARVADLVTQLDDRGQGLRADPRVLAIVSAHTHVADSHLHCIDHRRVREMVVGSTIDPPEQAAIVAIGPNEEGRLALRLRTLQSVARPGATCGADALPSAPDAIGGGVAPTLAEAVSAADCRSVAAELLSAPACRRALGTSPGAPPPRDCRNLERLISFPDQLAALRNYQGPRDQDQRKELRQLQTEDLLDCICRDGRCAPVREPLDHDAFVDVIAGAARAPGGQRDLTCLAWAAAAMQAHKATGMELGEALRCAFDDPTIPGELSLVATLESTPCF